MSHQQWWVLTNEKRYGPFSPQQLRHLAEAGKLSPDSKVIGDNMERPVEARRVSGLFKQPAEELNAPMKEQPKSPAVAARPTNAPRESVPPVASDRKHLAKQQMSPAVLVGSSVGGTLLIVGVIVFLVMLLRGETKEGEQNSLPSGIATAPIVMPPQPRARENTARSSIELPTVASIPPSIPNPKEHPGETDPIRAELASPESVVKAYLSASNWEDRLPLVLNVEQVRSQMAAAYRLVRLSPDNFLPGNVVAIDGRDAPIGGKCLVTVDVSKAVPDVQMFTYVVVRTNEGYKIDWVESQTQGAKDKVAAIERKLGNRDSTIGVEVLRWVQDSKYARADVKLTNNSKALFSFVSIAMDIHDSNSNYLGNAKAIESNVRAGQSITMSLSFNNVKLGEISDWKLSIDQVTIDQGSGRRVDATNYCALTEVYSGGAAKRSSNFVAGLQGHWREKRLCFFTSIGDYYFSSSKNEVLRVVAEEGHSQKFAVEVIERNYSKKSVVIRLTRLDPEFGLQFAVSLNDGKTVSAQITEVMFPERGFQELKESAKSEYVNEWVWINDRDVP